MDDRMDYRAITMLGEGSPSGQGRQRMMAKRRLITKRMMVKVTVKPLPTANLISQNEAFDFRATAGCCTGRVTRWGALRAWPWQEGQEEERAHLG